MWRALSVLAVSLCACSLSAEESKYEYHPDLPLYLGAGFDPTNARMRHPTCLEYDGLVQYDGQGAYSADVYVKVISSTRELLEEIGVSSSVSAQSFFVGGKAGVSHLSETSFQEDDLTLLVTARTDFGNVGMKKPHLNAEARQLLLDAKYGEFAKRCGTTYVDTVRLGSSVFALYTVHGIRQEQRNKLEATLSANAKLGFVSSEIESSVKHVLGKMARSAAVQCRVFVMGGKGIVQLSDVPAGINDLDVVKSIVASYMKTMTVDNAVPMVYYTGSMETFGYNGELAIDVNGRDAALGEYFFLVQDLERTRKRLRSIIRQSKTMYSYLTEEQLSYYRDAYGRHTDAVNRLTNEAKACWKTPSTCQRPNDEFDLDVIEWPVEPFVESQSRITADKISIPISLISRERCAKLQEAAFSSQCITKRELQVLRELNAVPFCVDGMLTECCYCEKKLDSI